MKNVPTASLRRSDKTSPKPLKPVRAIQEQTECTQPLTNTNRTDHQTFLLLLLESNIVQALSYQANRTCGGQEYGLQTGHMGPKLLSIFMFSRPSRIVCQFVFTVCVSSYLGTLLAHQATPITTSFHFATSRMVTQTMANR